METELAREMIAKYLKEKDEFEAVEIDFFGGEPMLAFDLIVDIVDWVKAHSWPKDYVFMINTNGTILNDKMKEWLYRHREKVVVGFSIDGNKTAHDISRDNSYDMVYRDIDFFKNTWPEQPAKMTICGDTIPYVADSVIELEEMGLHFTANVAFEDFWGDEEQKQRLLQIYENQLARLVEYYTERPHLFPVEPILTAVPDYLGFSDSGESMKKDFDRYCGAGNEMVAVDVDGKIYPCHRFFPWISGCPTPMEPVNCHSTWKPDNCANCKLLLSCPTCAGYNWEVNRDTSFRTTNHCESYKLEVLASAKLEAIKLSQRKQSEINILPEDELKQIKKRLEAVLDLIENGV